VLSPESQRPKAFSDEEYKLVQGMLDDLVRILRIVPGGGKIEEDYWSYIYHQIRRAPLGHWSNLPMRDYCYDGLGVEMKLLKRRHPLADQGSSLMHPAATRRIAFEPNDSAEACKTTILKQFANQISDFRRRVEATKPGTEPDLRWGVLLWSGDLTEFLYFEERMIEPNPDHFYAEFVQRYHRGRPTTSLSIYEKSTGVKRFSVTLPQRGAKVQPYFDVPRVGEGAYAFVVRDSSLRPLWLRSETIAVLEAAACKRSIDELILAALEALNSK